MDHMGRHRKGFMKNKDHITTLKCPPMTATSVSSGPHVEEVRPEIIAQVERIEKGLDYLGTEIGHLEHKLCPVLRTANESGALLSDCSPVTPLGVTLTSFAN